MSADKQKVEATVPVASVKSGAVSARILAFVGSYPERGELEAELYSLAAEVDALASVRRDFDAQFKGACRMSETLACVHELLHWVTSTKDEILASMEGAKKCSACGLLHRRPVTGDPLGSPPTSSDRSAGGGDRHE